MKTAIIGRSQILYGAAQALLDDGMEIALVVTSKEAPEYTRTSRDFEELARKCKAHFIYTPNLCEPSVIEKIKSLSIDLAVSINYSGIIEQQVIDLFKLGILNAHAGDLPRYRGNACQAWAILNGEDKIGLCIHRMIGGELDSGDIITRTYLPININTKIGEIYKWSEKTTPELMVQAVKLLSKTPGYVLEKQSKDPAKALRCYPRNPEDGKIDWTRNSEMVLRLINASSEPYSGAYCEFEEQKLIIWDAEIHKDDEVFVAVEGQIASIDKTSGAVTVICGNNTKLRLKDVQLNEFRGKPAELIKSIRKRLK